MTKTKVALLAFGAGLFVAGIFASLLYSITLEISGLVPNVEELHKSRVYAPLRRSLPPEASDIYYNCSWHASFGQAVFALKESDFLDWVRREGWQPLPVTESRPEHIRIYHDAGAFYRTISNGWHCSGKSKQEPGFGVSVTYDRKNSLVYFVIARGH